MFFSLSVITSLFLFCFSLVFSSDYTSDNSCRRVTFLHLIPFSKNEELSGWDERELHLIHLARSLAVQYINNSTSVLNNITLDVVDIVTDDCARDNDATFQDLVETIAHVSRKKCVFGVVGLYCSRVTRVIGRHLSHPNFGYIQLSSSASPLLQNNSRYPHLFRLVSSSILFSKTVIKMMDEFNWKNISLIYDFSDVFFRSTGIDFARQIQDRADLNLLAFFPIWSLGRHEVLVDIVKKGSRVTYFSVTHKESSNVLCDAYHHKFFWPKYIYIFVDDSLQEILASNKKCTQSEILQAAEGTILLLNRLSNSNNVIKSDINYQEYNRDFLSKVNSRRGGMLYYANVLYDQIWALTFAINNSMDEININVSGSFEHHLKHSPHIRNTLANKLMNISFAGASGNVKFNEDQEVLTLIDIFQVQNRSQVLIGEYNPYTDILTFFNNFDKENIPEDSFEVRHDAIPLWLGALVAFSQGFLLLLFALTCVYIIYWRKAPEIKSTSLRVSMFILSGCIMVIISSLFYNLENFSDAPATSITAFCNLESWLFLYGINFTLVALLFRLLRVFVIFHYPKTRIVLLADEHLVTYISITSLVPLIFLVIWTSYDHLIQVPRVKFVYSEKDPHYTEHFYCSSQYIDIWTGLYYSWIILLLLLLLILAIQTRHVKYKDFKDTKKITAFIFTVSFMLASLLPMSYLLQRNNPVGSYILKSLITFLIPFACLSFQYFPKLFPVLSQKRLSYISSNLTFKTSKFEQESIN